MPNKHLIFVVISFFTVAIISGSFFKFDVFGAEDSSCVPDFEDKSVQYCCYKHEGHTYCATCYQRSHGTWNQGLLTEWTFKHQKIQTSILEARFLGLLDNPTIQPSEDSSIQLPKSKGLLGLLDGTSPTIQEPSPETTTHPKDKTIDLLSNFDYKNNDQCSKR